MKLLLFIMILALNGYSGDLNYRGYGDTAQITTMSGTAAVTTKCFPLSRYEDLTIAAMVNDTAEAGFAADSVYVTWGIQTGTPSINGAGALDTTWNIQGVVDTLKTAFFGTVTRAIYNADLSYTKVLGTTDTLETTGFATQLRNIVPEWAPLFRIWTQGVSGNNVSDSLQLKFTVYRRGYVNTKKY